MKTLFTFSLMLIAAVPVVAQDLIVTAKGDSINCKITREKQDFVYFTYNNDGTATNTLLPLNEIVSYTRGHFTHSELPATHTNKQAVSRPWRFAVQGGYSYQIGKLDPNVPADFRDYSNKLRSGFHVGADAARYFNDVLGVGLKVSLLKQSNQLDNIWVDDGSGRREGRMGDDITVLFVAPTFATRYVSSNMRNAFVMNMSIGYLNYVNNAVLIDPFTMKGGTAGAAFDVGYDIGIGKDFQVGFQLSYTAGALSRYKINGQQVELDKDSRLGVNRVDISVGLRFLK